MESSVGLCLLRLTVQHPEEQLLLKLLMIIEIHLSKRRS